jgi:DNA gyrase subunit A
MIHYFVEHRHDVVTVERNLNCVKQRKEHHILEGLIIASDIDEVIALIALQIRKKQEEN